MKPLARAAYESYATAVLQAVVDLLPAQLDALVHAELVSELREDLTWLAARLVREAREDGATWQAVGDYYGVSRQAAQQRFG